MIKRALYDSTFGAPYCSTAGYACGTGLNLVMYRGGGGERNQPNTLDGCADENLGDYPTYGANDGILVTAGEQDGTGSQEFLRAGERATITATVYRGSASTQGHYLASFFYATDSNNPTWVHIDTVNALDTVGTQDLKVTFLIPEAADDQIAVRVQSMWYYYGYNDDTDPCAQVLSSGAIPDRDDLVFTILPVGEKKR